MAVYTPLSEADILSFLSGYDLGALHSSHGIAEGVENTNYLLVTDSGKYILTLFEKRVRAEDLPYFLDLMAWLEARGIHAPRPVPDKAGNALRTLKGKPAVILTFLEGQGVHKVRAEHMPLLGAFAARMHLAARDFPLARANALSFDGWQALAERIRRRAGVIEPGLSALIDEELAWLAPRWPRGLPQGAVHADLFPDNVFFAEYSVVTSPIKENVARCPLPVARMADNGERGTGNAFSQLRLTGVIDFYFACTELWMYDLAICLNAWCFDAGQFRPDWARAMFDAYHAVRPLLAEEREALPVLARGAALRFLLTRAHDLIFHPPDALVTPKDPKEYSAKLRFFRQQSRPEALGV